MVVSIFHESQNYKIYSQNAVISKTCGTEVVYYGHTYRSKPLRVSPYSKVDLGLFLGREQQVPSSGVVAPF